MTSRIHRGFHRIGVVLAGLALLMAAGNAIAEVFSWTITLGTQEASRPFAHHPPDFSEALVYSALALALYIVARAVGWVLAGFMGSDRP